MLRILEEKTTDDSTILRLDGRIVGQWVEVLRESCEQVFQSNGDVTLDLTGVSFADHDGVRLLRQLDQRQVRLINCSQFLQEQMKHTTKSLSPSGSTSE
jgi:anti-anti-sigma regulatory factor